MALYRSAFRLIEGCTRTCQVCPPNFQFFRTSFSSSKVLSVVVRVSYPGARPRCLPKGIADRDVPACVFCAKIELGDARS